MTPFHVPLWPGPASTRGDKATCEFENWLGFKEKEHHSPRFRGEEVHSMFQCALDSGLRRVAPLYWVRIDEEHTKEGDMKGEKGSYSHRPRE